jgi:HK97 family phage prohead protease
MKQTRFIPIGVCGLKVREAGEGEQSRTIEGTPIVFGVRSVNLTPWSETRAVYEVLEKGCITPELLKRSDVILNLNHNSNVTNVLGRFRNTEKDTLQLTLNEDNMECRCDMPHTNNANDTLELMRRGDITGMSFAFSDDYQDSENGVSYERTNETIDGKEVWLRHVKRITGLYDVSIVTHPAYEQTSVGTREAAEEIEKAIEEQLKREKNDHEGQQREETPEEKKAREERELEEQAEKAREMIEHRLQSQRRHMRDNVINKI